MRARIRSLAVEPFVSRRHEQRTRLAEQIVIGLDDDRVMRLLQRAHVIEHRQWRFVANANAAIQIEVAHGEGVQPMGGSGKRSASFAMASNCSIARRKQAAARSSFLLK